MPTPTAGMVLVMLYDPEDETSLVFATAPPSITSSAGSEDANIQLDRFGTLNRPMGRPPTTYSWEGVFYSAARYGQPWIRPTDWRPPEDIRYQLENWHDRQPQRLSGLQLLVSAEGLANINTTVYISRLDFTWQGGWGDLTYSLELTEWRSATVGIYEGEGGEAEGAADVLSEDPDTGEPPAISEYTVVEGDSLWQIAEAQLGDGMRWEEIYQANLDVVGPDPNLIYPGQQLIIPSGSNVPSEADVLASTVSYDDFVARADVAAAYADAPSALEPYRVWVRRK